MSPLVCEEVKLNGPKSLWELEPYWILLSSGDSIRVSFDGGYSGGQGLLLLGTLAEGTPNFEIQTAIPASAIHGIYEPSESIDDPPDTYPPLEPSIVELAYP